EVNLHESDTDLILKIGNFKRSIPKPTTLRHHEIQKASFEDQMLCVTFMERK
ncbi:MAG: ArsA family ATPase, partial [Vallitaleaceae bacterium]|nr:ArsA family ATPase [Vallitaleaceae bacterium]